MFLISVMKNLTMVVTVVLGVRVVICAGLPHATGRSGQCESDGYKFYFDHGTEACELCREICDYADLQRTEEQCEENCPRYVKAMQCKKEGLYFDELHDSCESCCQLCEFNSPDVPEFSTECQQKCPDFVAKLTSLQEPGQQGKKEADRLFISLPPCALTGEDTHSPPSNDYKLPGVIIIIVAAVVVCLIVIMAAFFIIRAHPPRAGYVSASTHGPGGALNSSGGQLQCPVEESGARQYVAVVDEEGTVTAMQAVPVKTAAFADLGVRHDRSQLVHV